MIHVCLACSVPVYAAGLRRLFHITQDIRLLAEGQTVEAALELIRSNSIDVLLLCGDVPEFETVPGRLAAMPYRPAVVLIAGTRHYPSNRFSDDSYTALLQFDDTDDEFIRAVRSAAKGVAYRSRLVRDAISHPSQKSRISNSSDRLTTTEQRVIQLLADNMSSKDIAQELCISYRTVQKHRENIARKLELRGSNALLTYAVGSRYREAQATQ